MRELGTWKPGEVILDLYEVLPVFENDGRRADHHSGGMGLVYRVRHLAWNIELALKVPQGQWFEREPQRAGFEHEAEQWVTLGAHPHTVTCHYVRRFQRRPCVFADYVAGGTLGAWLARGEFYRDGPAAALAAVLDMAIQVAWGLEHAHDQSVVHQDVKPANVLVDRDGHAQVADFGLARARAAAGEPALEGPPWRTVVVPGAGAHTPAYASPEQLRGERELTPASDVWSWAVTVLELFCGERRWDDGRDAPRVLAELRRNPDRVPLPGAVARLLSRCFESDPDRRPRRLSAPAGELQAAYAEAMGSPYPREAPGPAALLADGLSNRALSLLDLGRVGHAEAAWVEALRADPHHPYATYNQGLHLLRSGRLTGDELVRRMEAVRDSHENAWIDEYLLGLVHLERGDRGAAKAMLTSAFLMAPDDREILVALEQVERAGDRVRASWSYAQPASTRILRGAERAVAEARSRALSLASAGSFREAGATIENARRMPGWQRHPELLKAWRTIAVYGRRRALASAWDTGTLGGHAGPVSAVAVNGDGTRALTGSREERAISVWDLGTGTRVHQLVAGRPAVAVALSSDGRVGMSAGDEPVARVWDLAAGTCARELAGHAMPVTAVALTPDARFGLSGSEDGTLRVWDVATGMCLRTVSGGEAGLRSVALTHDGRRALSGGPAVQMWELGEPGPARTLADDTPASAPVALTHDGELSVSAHADGSIRLHQVRTGRPLDAPQRDRDPVRALAMTPDGRHVVSGSRRTVLVWDRAANVVLRRLTGHVGAVTAVAISPNAAAIVSGDEAGVLHLWELDWDVEFFDAADWYFGAQSHLHHFLRAHAPWPSSDPGRATWTDDDFAHLLADLRVAGYGWLRPDGVRRRLELTAGKGR